MKKILASLLAITMLMSTMSACMLPAAAAENPVLTDGFFEDFESYGDTEWLSNITNDIVDSTKITNMEENTWTVYGGYANSEYRETNVLLDNNASVKVVADPDNADNNVLYVNPGDESGSWIRVRRNSNAGSKVARSDLTGKKMVIKAKFKLPQNYKSTSDTTMLTYDQSLKAKRRFMNPTMVGNYSSTKWAILSTDSGAYQSNLNSSAVVSNVKTGEWFDIKYIVDLTEHKTENHPADTYRAFYNDSIYTHYMPDVAKGDGKIRNLNPKFPQPSGVQGVVGEKLVESFGGYITPPEGTTYRDFGDFYGVSMTVSAGSVATDYMYLDDIQVYYINPFKQAGNATIEKATEDGRWYTGKITIPFNNDLMPVVKENGTQLEYASLFTVKDAEGNLVEDGIANAYADGKNLVIEPSKALERNKEYTVYASALFMDVEGQGLNQFSKDQEILTFGTADDPFAHIYIDEDFENYTDLTSNWAKNRDSEGYVLTSVGVEEKAWMIGGRNNADLSKGGTVKIVKDPKNSGRGNVLMIDSSDIKDSGQNITLVKKPVDNGFVQRSTMDNKRIVIQADIYIPTSTEGFNLTEDTVFAYYNGKAGMNTRYPNANILPYNSMATSPYVIGSGEGSDIYAATRAKYGASGAWHTFKYVIDVSAQPSTTRVDTVRGYMDGVLMASPLGEDTGTEYSTLSTYPLTEDDGTTPRVIVDYWKRATDVFGYPTTNGSVGDFFGIFMANRPKDSNGGSAYYIDNMKSYYINDLTMTTPDLSNYTGGAIKLDFNNELPENFAYMVSPKAAGGTMKAPASPQTLKDVITLKDADGNVIENGLNIKLSSDKKSVTMVPNVESNKNYKIVISRFFRDAEGQGLTKNSTDTVLDLKVGDFVPFAFKGLSQNSVSGFMQGRDVKVTAEFSMNIDETMVTEGIVVKNADTEEVIPYGAWTYSYATDENDVVDYKKIVLDFTNLPTANYIVTTDADFAIGEEALEGAFVLEINQAAKPIVLFEEDFETGYTLGENWLNAENEANAAAAGMTTKNAGENNYQTADGKWDMQTTQAVSADDFVGVISADDITEEGLAFTSNVLKIEENGATKYSHALGVRRNFDIGAISLNSGEYAGKRLIYEADVYNMPKVNTNTSASSIAVHGMKVSRQATKVYEYDNSGWKNVFTKGGNFRIQEGGYAGENYGPIYAFQTAITTSPIMGNKMRIVVDQSTEKDTMRMYIDGVLQSKAYANYLDGHELNGKILADAGDSQYNGRGSNLGDTLYGIWNSSVDSVMYIDNFKAYLVDNFVVESVEGNGDVFNTAKGAVTFTFSKPVDEATVDGNVVLLDAEGNEVAGGIRLAEVSDAGYKLTVRLADTLPGKTTYTVKLKDGLLDIDGLNISLKYYDYNTYDIDAHYTKNANGNYDITIVNGKKTAVVECIYTPRTETTPATLKRASDGKYETFVDCFLPDYKAMLTEVELTTSKAQSLFAEATEATISGDTVTTNVTFINPEAEDMEVLCFIAVYGKYNQMIGCTVINTTVEAGTKFDKENVTVELKKSGADVGCVKMYVWDNEYDMNPYHKAEVLFKK